MIKVLKHNLIFFIVILLPLFNCQSINPWIFEERYSLYTSILNATKIPSFFGSDNLGNCLYGLPLQVDWQYNSGRLNVTTNSQGQHLIDEFSWWGDMNFYLSVVPYLAAMEAGLVPQVTITPPQKINASLFCYTFAECNQQLMSDWLTVFKTIQQLQINPTSTNVTHDQLLEIMWTAHTTSVKTGMALFDSTLDLFNYKEKKFGFGWGNFVEVLAVINYNTNETNVSTMEESLPPRELKLLDTPPFIFDMSSSQNNVVGAIFLISDVASTEVTWNFFLSTMKSVMSNPNCRALINAELDQFIQHPIQGFITILIDIVNSCQN